MADLQTVAADSASRRNGQPADFSRVLESRDPRSSSYGDARGALHAASDACHAAPDEPRVHYMYGECWAALNAPARAERAFAQALQLNPAWADAWINYGVARYRQGHIDDAKAAMRQALIRAPGSSGCHRQSQRLHAPHRRVSGRPEALLRGGPSRASQAMPARASTSSPICCRANAPLKRWRCSTLPRRPLTICARSGIGSCNARSR